MNKITVMNELLANKIAAGEVVERCSSVVKELVENSIDASAKNIKIDLQAAGIKEIKIIDDGIGMSRDDAVVAFERHATSKIKSEADLFFINSLGFRGEALPSIASVSEVILKTSEGDVGSQVYIKGGRRVSVENSDARVGTTITIKNIFFNTPARLKYLKSEQSELNSTINLLEKIALSYPDIKFTLTNNEKVILSTSGSDDLLKTIHEIYGLNVSKNMIYIKNDNDDYEVEGYICKPEILKSNRNHLHTIINGRIIKNLELNRMINDAYYTYKPDNKFPIVVIHINCDPTLIDVNIHPTKQDIKFSKLNELSTLINQTIKKALYDSLLIPNMEHKKSINEVEYPETITDEVIEEEQVKFEFNQSISNEINESIKTLEIYPVGLALGTYIIAQNDEGIYIVDQHAAQERINYEKYLQALKEEKVSKIASMFPITIELSTSESMIIKEHLDLLINMGIDIEEFGINTFVIKGHPVWLKIGYEEEQLRKIVDLVITNKTDFDIVKFNENVAITLACKTSIKANMNISMEEMEELIKELTKCNNPYNCPHGRPTIINFTKYELEKMFKRVV